MSSRPRLCMVVHARYPLAETRVEREAHVAIEAGFDVDVISLREPGEAAVEWMPDGVRVIRLPIRRVRGASAARVAGEYLGFTLLAGAKIAALHRRRRYAVVHVHNPPDFLIVAALVPKLSGARIVFDVHDLAPELFSMRFGDRPGFGRLERVLRLVERTSTALSDAVVTVHEPYRRALVARRTASDKITIVLNSVDERLLPPSAPRSSDAPFRIVYHGTVIGHYGLHTLIDALAMLRDRVPTGTSEIYGAGDALEEIKRRASKLGLDGRIAFSDGFLDNAEVLRRVNGASVGIVANLPIDRNQDALPTKLLEYVALGIPVVASDLRAVREHFDDSEITYFDGGDATSLADALTGIAADPASAERKAARARERYESYRWHHSASRYADLLHELTRDEP